MLEVRGIDPCASSMLMDCMSFTPKGDSCCSLLFEHFACSPMVATLQHIYAALLCHITHQRHYGSTVVYRLLL